MDTLTVIGAWFDKKSPIWVNMMVVEFWRRGTKKY